VNSYYRFAKNRSRPHRRTTAVVLALGAIVAATLSACGGNAGAAASSGTPGTLTIGMTAGDIPNLDTLASEDQGYEGIRFVGNQLYDGLTKFDLKQATATPNVIPALATAWTSNPAATQWTFTLRQGVKFSDGTPFDAAAVVFNLDRYTNKKSPYFSPTLAAYSGLTLGAISSYSATSPTTVVINTAVPQAALPSNMTTAFMASPTAVKKYGADFAKHPVGTGPFTFVKEVQGQELDLAANTTYWGGAPKISKLVLRPIADPATRTAALRSGEVNWIEYPNPSDIGSLKSAGYTIDTNSYDHIWPWVFDTTKKPWNDPRVREAANLAIDRQTMATSLLAGTADPAYQMAPRANGAYRAANDAYSFDPTKAKQLLAEAGYPNGFTASVVYPTSGSGNMDPPAMNQELQSDLAKVGIQIKLVPIEWATMLGDFAAGKFSQGASAENISLTFLVESSWNLYFGCKSPANLGKYCNPAVDTLLAKANSTLDQNARNDIYAQVTQLLDKDSPWLVVVNDRNPRALSPNVKGFIEPKSWFVDLTTVSVS
jgi:peptide/nickel transport system substrate-binding protein